MIYLKDNGIYEGRAEMLVERGDVTDKTSADDIISSYAI